MKHLPAKIAIILLAVDASLAALAMSTLKAPPTDTHNELQIVFYDVLSRQKEMYDVRTTTVNNGTLISTITNPNDNQFIFKGKFTVGPTQNQQINYQYTPIFYNNPASGRMIDGFIDYLTHNKIYMTPMVVDGQPLIYGLSGIFLDDIQRPEGEG
jgi:hypothetical protein